MAGNLTLITADSDFEAVDGLMLNKVMDGEEVQVLYGRSKKPVAQFTKIEEKSKKKKRIPGLYRDCGPFWEDENFEFTPENLFDNMDDLL